MTTLQKLSGLIVLDEVQRLPDLFELLRVLVDRPENRARFLLLGPASPRLIRGISESLAGRIGFIDLSGFDLRETGAEHQDRLWVRGGSPRSFLAQDDPTSLGWRDGFIRVKLTASPASTDMQRLDKSASMIGASRRYLVSKTARTIGDTKRASCNLPWLIKQLQD